MDDILLMATTLRHITAHVDDILLMATTKQRFIDTFMGLEDMGWL
jgi:hypothetical protein